MSLGFHLLARPFLWGLHKLQEDALILYAFLMCAFFSAGQLTRTTLPQSPLRLFVNGGQIYSLLTLDRRVKCCFLSWS